ncbi:hypothetical protein ACWCXH_12870 [Kitasatospora sp. NPDC001660]
MTVLSMDDPDDPDDPYTVGTFLNAADSIADAIHQQGMLGALSGLAEPLVPAVEEEVTRVVGGFLRLDMIDLLAGAWRTYAALTVAAERTLDAPRSEELVSLTRHRIRSVHHPTVNVLIDGVSVGTITVDVEVVFELDGVVAVVRGGRLVAVRAGYCTATAALAVEQIAVASRQGRFDLPGAVRFHRGVALLPPGQPPG